MEAVGGGQQGWRRNGREGRQAAQGSRDREGRKGEVEVTPTLEQSRLWAEPVAELGWFGCQVPLLPQRSPVLPPWETRYLPRAGTCRARGAGPRGPKPEHSPPGFPGFPGPAIAALEFFLLFQTRGPGFRVPPRPAAHAAGPADLSGGHRARKRRAGSRARLGGSSLFANQTLGRRC